MVGCLSWTKDFCTESVGAAGMLIGQGFEGEAPTTKERRVYNGPREAAQKRARELGQRGRQWAIGNSLGMSFELHGVKQTLFNRVVRQLN